MRLTQPVRMRSDNRIRAFLMRYRFLCDIDIEIAHSLRRELRIRDNDPLSARAIIDQSYDTGRDGWRIRTETRLEMWSTETDFHIEGWLRVQENGEALRERKWHEVIPRDLI